MAISGAEPDEPVRAGRGGNGGEHSGDAVRDYLREVGRTALVTAAEEVDLARRIEAGVLAAERLETDDGLADDECAELAWLVDDGAQAKQHLLEANLRLVVSIAKHYTGRGVPLLDLVQEGNLGLIRAVEKFDWQQGYKFSTYATWWIRQTITRALATQSRTIRVPVHVADVVNRVRAARHHLNLTLGRDPSPDELAEEVQLSVAELAEIETYAREPVSLDLTLGEDGRGLEEVLEDQTAPPAEDVVAARELRAQIFEVLHTVGERAAGVVSLRYGLHDGIRHTFREISERYGVSRERVRQIESAALSQLAHEELILGWRDHLN